MEDQFGRYRNEDYDAKVRAASLDPPQHEQTRDEWARADAQKLEVEPTKNERTFSVLMTESLIRRLAKLSPEANRKLRQQVPDAFLGEQATGADLLGLIYPEINGAHKGMGLHLPSAYSWEIVPNQHGIGSTLIARKKL